MLLVDNNETGSTVCSGSRSPSILDSPTLARVQRARLRQEAQLHHTLSSYCPSLLSVGCGEVIKKGLLWQQRERLFSRWKERFFILTRDYLHCFKRSSRSDKISDMGQFIFKVKLVDVVSVEWINRKSYSIVALELSSEREPRILLRTEHDLESWFELLEECMMTSKERRRALRKYGSSVSTSAQSSQNSDQYINTLSTVRSNIHNWFSSNSPEHLEKRNFSDSVPDLTQIQARRKPEFEDWRMSNNEYSMSQRHSLLTDIDINNCDSPANSVRMSSIKGQNGIKDRSNNIPIDSSSSRYASRQPYHFSKDVFFVASIPDYDHQVDSHFNSVSSSNYSSSIKSRPVLTPTNSFRNSLLLPNFRQPHDRPLPATPSSRDQHQSNGNGWNYKAPEPKNCKNYILQTMVQE